MKIGIKTFFKNSGIAAFLLAFIFAFPSCEIGLGAAVDVDQPVLNIVSPSASLEARNGTIVFQGTCSDDRGVKEIVATLTNNDSPDADPISLGTIIFADSDVKPNQEWEASLVYNENSEYNYVFEVEGSGIHKELSLKDGTYILDMIGTDSAGRQSGRESRVFDIDNTPPIFLLSSPSSFDMTSPTRYGRTITLKGTISDDHPASKKGSVKAYLYKRLGSDGMLHDEDKIQLASEFDIADTANVSIVIAEYAATPSDEKQSNYDAAYTQRVAENGEQTQTAYLVIEVQDDTMGPNGPNKNTRTYIRENLIALTRETLGDAELTLEGSDLKQIWNGTYDGDLGEASRSSIVNILEGNVSNNNCIGEASKPYAISVNKNVNPTFSFSGYGLGANNGNPTAEWSPSNNDSYLAFNVKAGLDKSNVRLNTLVVKIYKYTDGEALNYNTFVWSSEGTENVCEGDSHRPLKDMSTTTDDGTYSVKLPGAPAVSMDQKYLIIVEGKDLKGNDLVAAENSSGNVEYYGFETKASGTVPSISSTTDKIWKKWVSGESYPMELSITDSMGDSSNFKATGIDTGAGLIAKVKLFNGKKTVWEDFSDAEATFYNLKSTGAFTDGGVSGSNVYKQTLNLPAFAASANMNYTYEVEVKATNGVGSSNPKQYLLWIDNSDPVITFPNNSALNNDNDSVPVTVTENDAYYDSTTGEYKLFWSATDTSGSGLVLCESWFDVGTHDENGREDRTSPIESFTSSDHKISSITEREGVKLKFVAKDAVGNTAEREKTVTFDFSAPIFTDSIADKTSFVEKTSGKTFDVTASDGLGIQSLTLTPTRASGGDIYSGCTSINNQIASNKKTAHASITFSSADANDEWTIKAVVEDISGRKTEKTFYVVYDATSPVVNDSFTVNGRSYNSGDTNYLSGKPTLNVTVNEDVSGLASIYYLVQRNTEPAPTSMTGSAWTEKSMGNKKGNTEASISTQFTPASDGAYDVLYICAKDVAGNISAPKGFNVFIDNVIPSLSYKYYSVTGGDVQDASSTIHYKSGQQITLYGELSDLGSGIDNLEIEGAQIYYSETVVTKTNASSSSISWSSSVESPRAVKSWRAVISPTNAQSLNAVAEDKAGMKNQILGFCTFKNDAEPPEVTIDNVENNGIYTEQNMSYNETDGKYHLTVRGKWSDNLSGTAKLMYTYNNGREDVSGHTNTVVEDANKGTVSPATDWSFDLPIEEGADQKITLKAWDLAGNDSSATPLVRESLTFDTSRPRITSPAYESVYNTNNLNANKATIAIHSEDTHGIASVEASYVELDGTSLPDSQWSSKGFVFSAGIAPNGKSADSQIELTAPLANGKWKIRVTVTDNAGRTDEKSLEFVVDGTIPVINRSSFTLKGAAWSADKFYGQNDATMSFSGTVNESVGIGKIYYKLVQGTISGSITDGTAIPLTGASAAIQFSGTVSGFRADSTTVNHLYLQAEDAAGNLSLPEEFIVHMDDVAPTFSATHYMNGTSTPMAFSETVLTSGAEDLTIFGNCSDSLSGMEEIDFKVGGASVDSSKFVLSYTTTQVAESALTTHNTWTTTIAADTKTWKAVIDKTYLVNSLAGKTIYATVKDKAGNVTERKAFALSVDTVDPSISGFSISGAYKNSVTEEYYVGNRSVTLSGSSSDDKGLASTTIVLKKGTNVVGTPVVLNPQANAVSDNWSHDFDFTSWADNDVGTFEVTVLDTAGRKHTDTYTINVDKTGPVMLHNIYPANYTYQGNTVYKDRMFYMGAGQYSASSFTNKTSFDVSGYFKETGSGVAKIYYQIFHRTDSPADQLSLTTLDKATGVFTEFTTPTPRPKRNGADLSQYKLNADGTLATDANDNPIEVPWDSSTYYNFTMSLNGFEATDANNNGDKLYLIVEDYCGNKTVCDPVLINVDQTAANVTPDSNDVVLTNGVANISLGGTASDNLSGVKIIDFELRGKNNSYYIPAYDATVAEEQNEALISYLASNTLMSSQYGSVRFYAKENGAYKDDAEKIDFDKTGGTWTAPAAGQLPNFYLVNGPCDLRWELTITPGSWFTETNLGTAPRIYANVKDYAGNSNSYPVGTLNLDTQRPLASIDSPSAENAVNGKYDVIGISSDNNSLKSVYLYKYVGASAPTALSGWGDPIKGYTTETEPLAVYEEHVSVAALGTCTFHNLIDFNDFAGSNGTGTVHLLLVAYDTAGNCSVDTTSIANGTYKKTYTVDLNTDRPTVKFNEIFGNGSSAATTYTAKYTSRIYGTITDDDGIAEIKISSESKTSAEAWASYTQPANTLSYESGSTDVAFNYEPNGSSDGEQYLYIYVKDTAGGEFWTASANTYYQPYVRYAGSTSAENLSGVVMYRTDSNPPNLVVASGFGATSAAAKADAVTKLRGNTTMGASEIFGGLTARYMAIAVGAHDSNGIKNVKGSALELGTGVLEFTDIESTTYVAPTGIEYEVYTHVYDTASLGGQKLLEISAEDNSDLVSKRQIPVIFDNVGPIVAIGTNSNTTIVGTVEIQGTSYDELGSNVADLWCTILNNDYYSSVGVIDSQYVESDGVTAKEALKTKIKEETHLTASSFLSWSAVFDRAEGTFKKLPTSDDGLENYSKVPHTAGGVYTMKVAVLAVDSLGNESVSLKDIKYNPYGDRPMVEILSPAVVEDETSHEFAAKASGALRVSGTALDNELVQKVYVQIALGHNEYKTENGPDTMGEFSSTSAVWSKAVAEGCGYTTKTKADLIAEGIGSDFTVDSDFWGIEANSTGSWYIVLNKNDCMQKDASADDTSVPVADRVYTVWVRAAAIDNKGILGDWSTPIAISINPKSPAIGNHNPIVRLYDDAGNLIGEKPYEDSMWIKGHARLVTTAEHKNGISEISVAENEYRGRPETNVNLVSDGETLAVPADVSEYSCFEVRKETTGFEGQNVPGFEIVIPIHSWEGSGTREIRVNATEASESGLSKEQVYTFRYDNTVPSIESLEVNGDPFFVATESAKKKLQNSNKQLSIGGAIGDTGSGFDRLLFAFYRGSSDKRILDVMHDKQEIAITGNVVPENIAGVTVYGNNANITWASSTTTFTLQSADSHVQKRGMVLIGGVWYLITNVSGTSVTIEGGVPDVANAPGTAFFPYMQVVDNVSAEQLESWDENGHTFKAGRDDGDGMSESVSKSGATWTWDATLHGNFMRDGPVTFVALAMDKAGNISSITRDGSVENSPPRIAKVYLGTDLSGNDQFEDEEFELYDISGVTSMNQEAYDLTTENFSTVSGSGTSMVIVDSDRSAFKAINKLAIKPEIIGGNIRPENGEVISMVFKNNATTQNTHYMSETDGDETYTYPLPQKKVSDSDLRAPTTLSGNTKITSAYILENSDLAGDSWASETYNDDPNVVSFTFWDCTDECTPGEDSQSCVLRVMDLRLSLTDSVPPRSVISPLYWNSGSDNSLYKHSKNNGHIELSDAWQATTSYNADNAQYDADPKVSGKITLTGYAYDETRIESLIVNFGNIALTGYASGGDCKPASGKKTIASVTNNFVGAYCVSKVWTSAPATMEENGWEFKAENIYQDQRGHKAKWTLSIDTSRINLTSPAKTNVGIYVYAMDQSGATSPTEVEDINTTSELDGERNDPKLQVDIVPYILGFKTSLSSQSGKSPYERTALGHFPIRVNETFYVYGFNLAKNAVLTDKSGNSVNLGDPETKYGLTVYSVNANNVKKNNASSKFESGKFTVTVGGVVSINNMNDNDTRGAYSNTKTYRESKKHQLYANYPNRFPDGNTNNTLTDDMELDVWQFNSTAVKPHDGRADEPCMQINPYNKKVGFSFLNGAYRFSMPKNNDNSFAEAYKTKDFVVSSTFTYDTAGNTYGCAAGQDSDDGKGDAFYVIRVSNGSWAMNGVETTGQMGMRLDGYKKANSQAVGDSNPYNLKNKIKNPSMATYRSGSTTNVYLAYYDSWNDEIRFRYGTSGFDNGLSAENGAGQKTNFSGFGRNSGYYECRNVQVLATTFSKTSSNDETPLETLYKSHAESSTGPLGPAGEYVSIATVPSTAANGAGTVVMVWYDAKHNNTLYSYNTNPTDTSWYTTGTTLNDVKKFDGLNRKNWSNAKTIFTGAGEFCQVKVDGKGGVHIAAYDGKKGDLRYAKLESYAADYTESSMSCVVDSRSVVGKQLTLDVVLEGSGDAQHAVPYIGYVYENYPKLAYLASTGVSAGATEDFFTGKWEVTCVPTPKEICKVYSTTPNNSRINVGLWKDSNGVKTSSSTTAGNIVGNGTAYPILGYQVWDNPPGTRIETAQMR